MRASEQERAIGTAGARERASASDRPDRPPDRASQIRLRLAHAQPPVAIAFIISDEDAHPGSTGRSGRTTAGRGRATAMLVWVKQASVVAQAQHARRVKSKWIRSEQILHLAERDGIPGRGADGQIQHFSSTNSCSMLTSAGIEGLRDTTPAARNSAWFWRTIGGGTTIA